MSFVICNRNSRRTAMPTSSGNLIRLPEQYRGAGCVDYHDGQIEGMDSFARAALETLRDSYHCMPTGSVKEFARVFSKKNYDWLSAEVQRQSGYPADEGELFDAMISAFTMVGPRTDVMDVCRRLNFSDEVTASYVDEINRLVLERLVEETRQAHKLWDFYAKNRNGPSELPDSCDIDTRTRLVGSFYAFDYWMPE